MPLITLTVAELYAAIWATPLCHLAQRWQVNAHALGQLLDEIGLPRPKSGYWTQQALKQSVAVAPLPDTLSPTQCVDLTPLQATQREKAKLTEAPLPRPAQPTAHYPLLKGVKASMTTPKFEYEFLMVQPYNDTSVARLDVSPQQQRRAITILHRLFDTFRRRGWQVQVEPHRYAKRLTNIVVIDGGSVPFRLRERLRQQPRKLDQQEQDAKAKGRYVWYEKINVPSGCLQLTIEGPLPAGEKGLFEDGPALTLEQQLAHVVRAVAISAEHANVVKAQREAEQQRWEAQRRQQAAYERSVMAEQQRIHTLLGLYAKWQAARDCRVFLRELAGAKPDPHMSDAQRGRFCAWATAVIDALDPVVNGEAVALMAEDMGEQRIAAEAIQRYRQSISD